MAFRARTVFGTFEKRAPVYGKSRVTAVNKAVKVKRSLPKRPFYSRDQAKCFETKEKAIFS